MDNNITNLVKLTEQVKNLLEGTGNLEDAYKSLSKSISEGDLSNNFLSTAESGIDGFLNLANAAADLGAEFKGLAGAAKSAINVIPALLESNPAALFLAAGASLVALVNHVQETGISVEEQKKKLFAAKTSFVETKNELQTLGDELNKTQAALRELENQEGLSLVDMEELSHLREITAELEMQKKLKEEEALEAGKTLYEENEKTFRTEFASSYGADIGIPELLQKLSSEEINLGTLDTEHNITDMAAAIQFLNEEKKELTNTDDLAEYESTIEAITGNLSKKIKENGLEYLTSLSSYKQNLFDLESGEGLTEEQQKFLQSLSSMQKLIYEYLQPDDWNSLRFASVFDREEIEVTKDELIAMAKEGSLSEDTIKSYQNLNLALEQSDLLLEDGETAAAAFLKQIQAWADTAYTVPSLVPWDYSKTVAELNTAREKFDVLNRSLTELRQSGGQLDFEDLSAIREAFSDLSGIDSYVRKLQEAGGNTEAVNAVMQDLVNEYLNYSGILDNITDENAGLVVSALEVMGITNAQLLITEQLAAAKEYLALTGKRVEESEWGEIAAVLAGTEISQTAAENLAKLTLAKLNLNEQRINSDDDIAHIIAIANAAGASAEYLDVMRNSLKTLAVFGNGQKEKITVNENQLVSGGFGGAISDFYYRKFIKPAQKNLSEILNEIAPARLDPEQFKADYKGGIINDAAKAAGDAVETDWKEALDHCLNLYRAELDSGLIEFSVFLDKSRTQFEKFYSDGTISAKDYWDYVGNLYEEKLSGYDRVISAVTDRIDEEIDALEKQKEASEQSYQVKIDAIQEEIDKLEEANKKREEQIDLESAQWELERARNQRTKAVFNGSEKIYTADTEKIREAQDNLEDKEFRLHISDLESQIQSLEEEMKQASNTIDDQIATLKDYKEQWQTVADAYEKSRDRMYADQILGQNWEAEILSGRIETLNAFKDQYVAIQQAIADAAWHSAAEQIKAEQAAQNGAAGAAGDVGDAKNSDSSSGTQTPTEEKDPVTGKTIASALRPQKYAAAAKSPSNGYLPVKRQNELWEKCKNLLPNAPGILSPASLLPLTGYSYGNSIGDHSVSVTIGDIHLHNVQNTDSLSRAILKELPGRLTQAVSHK